MAWVFRFGLVACVARQTAAPPVLLSVHKLSRPGAFAEIHRGPVIVVASNNKFLWRYPRSPSPPSPTAGRLMLAR